MFDVNIPGSVSYEESHEICPGNEIVLADTALGLFGMSICYDIRFPEQYRLMASSGADAFLIAADFTKATGERHWEALLRTRAIENGCYVLAANQCGQKARFEAYGHSMIIAPDGEFLRRQMIPRRYSSQSWIRKCWSGQEMKSRLWKTGETIFTV